ncbi:response regulator [Neorhizobium sp. LMR1-1-1.1]
MTDPGQLETALLNLVANARDAMPSGGAITISARPVEISSADAKDLQLGSYVCLLIEDDGEGMDEATLAKVTEPFFTTKGIGKGTGLGLPMVDGLAAQSGGKLVLRSQPGVGTSVELWLPVADPETDSIVETASGKANDAEPQRTLKVLAVDDDALVLMNTAAMLEDLGHLVIEASYATQAIEIIRQESIDLVVTDHAMPGMTGLQLVEVVGGTHPNLPFVLATGYAELPNGSARPFVKLDKPFMQDQLADAVSQAFTPGATSQ